MNDRRKNKRISISYHIIYMGLGSNGKVDTQGIGLALDISSDGMMFESDEAIDATKLSIHASSSSGTRLKVDGDLIYSMPSADGKYRSAIRFEGLPDQISLFVAELCGGTGKK
jgi:hypothetical protein